MTARRRRLTWLLLVAFVLVPLAEIYVLVQVGQVIGVWWTLLLLVLDSFIGAWLIRREGGRAWGSLSSTLSAGRMPAREIADGALVLLGGALMLSPGFVTDALGILLVLPVTRPFFRRALTSVVARRLVAAPRRTAGPFGPFGGPGQGRRPGPDVVRGDVVDGGVDES